MQNWQETVLSQYANSPSILTILEGFNQAVDPSAVIDDWYANVWDVQTATGWGLDVWGRIVGVNRVLQVATTGFLGFAEAYDGSAPSTFNQGIFFSGGASTSNYALTDDAYRLLIMAKAAANITDGSITSLNAILMSLFSDSGQIWVVDYGNMAMGIFYDWDLTPVQSSIIVSSGVLPRPSGVSLTFQQVPSPATDQPLGEFTLGYNTIS